MKTQRQVISEIRKHKGPIYVTMLIREGTLMIQAVKSDLLRQLNFDLDVRAVVSTRVDGRTMYVHNTY